jgi:hypothetical protein
MKKLIVGLMVLAIPLVVFILAIGPTAIEY